MRTKTSPIARAIALYVLALMLLATIPTAVFAQQYYQHEYGRHQYGYHNRHGAGPAISAERATAIALTRFPGYSVRSVKLMTVGNRMIYRVHLRSGHVRQTVDVGARNGRILSVQTKTVQREHQGRPYER